MAFGALLGTMANNANSITNPFNARGTGGTIAVAAGDLVFAVIMEQTTKSVTGAFDNLGNIYTAIASGVATSVTGAAFYAYVSVPGTLASTQFTTTAGTDNVVAIAAAFQGPFDRTPLDVNPANTNDWTTAFTCPSSGTLATVNELVACWSVINNGTLQTAAAPNTLATAMVSQAVVSGAVGYQTVSTTSAISPAFNDTTSTNGRQGTASFKMQASPKGIVPSVSVYQPLIAQ